MKRSKFKVKQLLQNKIAKIIFKSLICLFVVIYLLVTLLNTSLFQTIIANSASNFFSQQWQTELRISAISIDIFRGIKIHDVYLEDQKGDTIIAADDIRISFDFFPFYNGLNVNRVTLNDVTFNLCKNDGRLNFAFIIDYFKSNKEKKKKNKKAFVVRVKHVSMKNVNFLLDVSNEKPDLQEGLFNGKYEKYTNINAEISNIKVIKDSVLCEIKHFETRERSGFVLNNLMGKIIASPSLIEVKGMNLITPFTHIYADCRLQATSWKTYKYFMDSVNMNVVFRDSTLLGGKDATFWTKSMQGFTEKFNVKGNVNGCVANMKIGDLEIINKNTHIALDGVIEGLPDVTNTYCDLNLKDLTSSCEDINGLAMGKIGENIKLPKQLANIGTFSIVANVKGMMKEFDAAAFVTSQAGTLDLIAKSVYDETSNVTTYAAELNSGGFNIGQVLDNDMFGTADVNAKVSFKGTDFKQNMTADIDVDLHYATIKGNTYNIVNCVGKLHNGKVDACLNIEDKDIVMMANAIVDLTDSKRTSINFSADIDNADLAEINFFTFADSNAVVSAKIEADIRNLNMKMLDADVNIKDFEVRNTKKDFTLNNFNLNIASVDTINKQLTINSEVFDFRLFGRFELNEIGGDFANVIKNYLPDFKEKEIDNTIADTKNLLKNKTKQVEDSAIIHSDITFDADLKNVTPLLHLFIPQIELNHSTKINGSLNNEDKLKFNFTSREVKLSSILLENFAIKCEDKKGTLAINLTMDKCFLSDSLYLPQFNGQISTSKEKINMSLLFDDKLNKANQLEGNLNLGFFIDGKNMHGSFANSYLQILNRKININENNLISYNGEKLSLINLMLYDSEEKIQIDGNLSESIDDSLKVKFENLDISLLNSFLKESNTILYGRLNETVILKTVFDKPVLTSSLRIDDLKINDISLGYAWLNVNKTYNTEKLYADIKLLKQDSVQNIPLSVKGYINLNDEKDNLDLSVGFKNFNVGIIQKYLAKFSSKFSGYLFADNIKVKGKFNQPDIRGNLFVKDGVIKIDMIGTTYFFDDTIKLNNNYFSFNNFMFYDEQQNKIVLNGSVNHKEFRDYNINLIALADKIKILNTKASANTKYYGTAYASASVKLDGDLNLLNIDIKAKTEKGTMLVVPVSSKMSAKENDFIVFSAPETDSVSWQSDITTNSSINNNGKDEYMKLNISMDLSVTPDAQINVPMDFKEISGSLSAFPSGDLKIDIDTKGDVKMYGKVDIDKGNFNMGLLSAVARNFVLQKGGSIQFTGGSPSEAQIDIKAIYKTKAPLTMLGEGLEYRQKADVDCIVNLTENLTDPKPSFDIQLPNTDQQTTDKLFNVLNLDKTNSETMFMQVASLMITGGFYQDGGDYATNFNASYVENSAFDALFSQVNSKISNFFNVDFTGGVEMSDDETVGNRLNAGVSKDFGRWYFNVNTSFNQTNQQQSEENSDITSLGIFEGNVGYRITDNLVIQGYNKSNKDNFEKMYITPYTQGIGLQYRRQYRKFSDIFRTKRKK
ncbi:MAG: translocation/assembly module TamB [Bacteroidales bacterium]|jgi:hypothetical protein|nr:translocation/assembly module TamB [Bacteroidales bacterium]